MILIYLISKYKYLKWNIICFIKTKYNCNKDLLLVK